MKNMNGMFKMESMEKTAPMEHGMISFIYLYY